jgi:hypothetical protein
MNNAGRATGFDLDMSGGALTKYKNGECAS